MRQKMILLAILLLCFFTFQSVHAQKKKNNEIGFWQIVSQVAQPRHLTIQFYTNDRQLIYEEILTDIRLNISRKNIRRKLDRTLQEAYEFWSRNQTKPEANDLLAKRL